MSSAEEPSDVLPAHEECCYVIESGQTPTALQQFIYDNEPADAHKAQIFRQSLVLVLSEAKEAAL